MAREQGSIRWHRGGWELAWHEGIRRRFRRFKAPNTRAGRRQAEAELDRLRNTSGEPTVAEVIEEYRVARWSSFSPSTRAGWESNAKDLIASLGARVACDLTVADVEGLYNDWLAAGIAPATIRRRNAVLSAAMIRAERLGVVAVAVTRRVQVPAERDEAPPDLPDVADVLTAIQKLPDDVWIKPAARVAIATGMRRGELCGLRWSDIDIDAGTLSVRGAIAVDEVNVVHRKSTKSKRASTIEALDSGTVAVLDTWRTRSQAQAAKLGVDWVPSWPVFGAVKDPSRWLNPTRVTRAWINVRDQIGLADVRWHDLRHINASELIAAGVDPKTAAERLGHDPSMLLARYAHARPARDQIAADVIAAAEARSKRNKKLS